MNQKQKDELRQHLTSLALMLNQMSDVGATDLHLANLLDDTSASMSNLAQALRDGVIADQDGRCECGRVLDGKARCWDCDFGTCIACQDKLTSPNNGVCDSCLRAECVADLADQEPPF